MFVLMTECAENFVQHFLKKDEDVVTIEMKDAFTRLTNDVIATIAFGVTVDSLENPTNEFYLMGKKATNTTFFTNLKLLSYIMIPNIKKLISITLFSKEVGAFFRGIIDRTVKVREEQGILRRDMVHLLLQARKGKPENKEEDVKNGSSPNELVEIVKTKTPHQITNEDITAQALIFFFGGFESVAGLMCFLAYELALNPEIQERLRNEVQAFEEGGGELTQDVLTKMKYMDMVVSETLRKWPSFVSTDRVCTKPYTIEPKLPGEKPVHLKKGILSRFPSTQSTTIHNTTQIRNVSTLNASTTKTRKT
ncbi:hypothetical protein NQ317_001067 [Molorchus minor]|uniref:Cytochrome P450 n=1 Tax=Molorchus minor TaxID=1323400 RepID=A0ABQ9IQU8_9CUCU|nr:hypothetical protein NQ317_001067 [Molorchus minor]